MTENEHMTLFSIACSGLACVILLVFRKLIKLYKFEKEIPLAGEKHSHGSCF